MSFLSSIGSALNNLTGVSSSQKKTYQQQLASTAYQNAYNASMWQAQNEYNSPTAQLARMREAGIDINPTSYALGTGNLSNTATFVGSEGGFSGSGSPAGNPISQLMGMASGILGVRETQARIDNMKEQKINIMTEGNRLFNQVETQRLENEIMRHNLEIGRKTHLPVNQYPSFMGTKFDPQQILDTVGLGGKLGQKVVDYFR